MIKITVELWPKGSEHHKRHLGTAEIWNDGKGTATRGNYRVRLSKRGMPNATWKTGVVEGFPRKRLLAWDLLYRALHNLLADRNTP